MKKYGLTLLSEELANFAGDVTLGASEVSRQLRNTFTKSNFVTQNPYRFVFLDGCSTAATLDWARSFGIYPLNEVSDATRNNVGAQAFVGWWKPEQDWLGSDTKGQPTLALAYTRTLRKFYENWMDGMTVNECIHSVSDLALNNMVPFPVPEQAYLMVYGDGWQYLGHITTSPIVVIGHSGLKINGWDRNQDGAYPMPKK